MKKLFFSLFLLASISLEAQYITTEAKNAAELSSDGIFYYLPRNVIKIDFTIQETQYYIGPYAEYASLLLNADEYVRENMTEYTIKDIDIEVVSQVDPQASFYVALDEKSKESNPLKISLTEDGIIQTFGYNEIPENLIVKNDYNDKDYSDYSTEIPDVNFIQFIVNDDDNDDDSLNNSINYDKEDIAKLIVAEIQKIRSSYYELVSGFQEVSYGNAINFMAEATKNLENEYLSLFLGKKNIVTYKKTVYVTPEKEQNNSSITIAKLSQEDGFTTASKSGTPVKIQFETKTAVGNNINPTKDGKIATTFSNKLIYRIPAVTNVKISLDNKILIDKQLKISQFGKLALVPANGYKIIFDTNTGQVKSVLY